MSSQDIENNYSEMFEEKQIHDIAKICHQANKAYCESIDDFSQSDWDKAPEWQRESAIKGVIYHLDNPFSTPADSHNEWLKVKKSQGWTYGPQKDPEAKTHHCTVPFEDLSIDQQGKHHLFRSIVHTFLNLVIPGAGYEGLNYDSEVIANKALRRNLDKQLQHIKGLPKSRERSLAFTKLQEGIMWLGMDLKRLNEKNPYPNSYNPSNTIIEPTADDLKL